ncbi:MAG: phospholipid transport system substrate-binding protein [Myxococcota bacterium]|jgi:phospholipid transport system substrate-binding protein
MKKIIILFSLFFVFINSSFADETKKVEKFIDDFGKRIMLVVDDKNLDVNQKREGLIKIVDGIIDSNWISKFVLGRNYRIANKEQKEEFKVLYRDFMINAYSPKFTDYRGEIFSIDSVINNGNYYTVECLLTPKDDTPTISIDFRVRKNTAKSAKTDFIVFDIVAEGISLIETQRSEFGSAIDRDGIEKFMFDLKERTATLKSEYNSPDKADKN